METENGGEIEGLEGKSCAGFRFEAVDHLASLSCQYIELAGRLKEIDGGDSLAFHLTENTPHDRNGLVLDRAASAYYMLSRSVSKPRMLDIIWGLTNQDDQAKLHHYLNDVLPGRYDDMAKFDKRSGHIAKALGEHYGWVALFDSLYDQLPLTENMAEFTMINTMAVHDIVAVSGNGRLVTTSEIERCFWRAKRSRFNR
jgi:hypothetical protein